MLTCAKFLSVIGNKFHFSNENRKTNFWHNLMGTEDIKGSAQQGSSLNIEEKNIYFKKPNKKTRRAGLGFFIRGGEKESHQWPPLRPPHARQGAAVVMVVIIMRVCCPRAPRHAPQAARGVDRDSRHGMACSLPQCNMTGCCF